MGKSTSTRKRTGKPRRPSAGKAAEPAAPSRKADALATRLPDLSRWWVIAECDGCDWKALLPIKSLMEKWGDRPLSAVVKGLSCTQCARRPSRVHLSDRVHRDASKPGEAGWSVKLVG